MKCLHDTKSSFFEVNSCIKSRVVSSACMIALKILLNLFNSGTAIGGAIIGLLLVFLISSSKFFLRPYDVTATSNLIFVPSFMQFELKCVRDVIIGFSGASFFVHSRD